MTRAWLIRAGEDASKLAEMVSSSVIAVRYPQIQTNAKMLSSEQIEELIAESGRSQPGVRRVRLEWFVNDVAVGDLVITPDAANHEVWFAKVVGDYLYDPNPPVPGYFHWRDVRWLGAMDRDLLPEDRRKEISVRPTIVQDLELDWWGEMASTVPPPGSGKVRSSVRVGKPLAPSKGPQPTATKIVCGGEECGLLYSPSSLVGGLCPDCRAKL